MQKILFSKKLSIKDHFRIAKSLFIFTNSTAFLVYAFLRLLFYNTPISVSEDAMALLTTFKIGSIAAVALYILLLAVEVMDLIISNKKIMLYPAVKYTGIAGCMLLVLYLTSCKPQLVAGTNKNVNTGVTTSYSDIEPANTVLVMNNEVLNHTDIPLGENFVLINDDVKGLVEKNGKISAGCQLVITDKKGNEILSEPDLFKGEDVFTKEKVKTLKCTIFTGKPMHWDENYDVAVTFWDKYGNGRIENRFSVRMTDKL